MFADGYLVVAANEQMLHRAVRARQGGQVLRGSWRFQQLLPPDREANFSAVVYHNLGEAASAVAGWLGGTGALQSEQQEGLATLDRLVRDAKPGLFYVYGGNQDIQVASTGGFFGVTLDHVVGSAGLSDLLTPPAARYHHAVSTAEAGESADAREGDPARPVIALDDLRVSLGGRPVLKGLTCELRGRCIGLLGPNGAGKSTLINTLLGFHPLAGGSARVFGRDLVTEPSQIRSAIGYMPESDAFIADMTGVAFVRYMAELAGLPPRLALERTHEAFLYVGLGEARYRKLGTYSLGMKQMAKLAQAIVHGPRLLLLDEPTNGLDPPGRTRMLKLIRDIRDTRGVHLLVSSHLLRDVEECCDEVLILKNGILSARCNLAEERRAQRKFLELETVGRGGVPRGRRASGVRIRQFRQRPPEAGAARSPDHPAALRRRRRAGRADPPLQLPARFPGGHLPPGHGDAGDAGASGGGSQLMAVHRRAYRPLAHAELTPRWSRFLVLPRFAAQGWRGSRLLTAFLMLCLLPPLVAAVVIYVFNNALAQGLLGLGGGTSTWNFRIDGQFFAWMNNIQGVAGLPAGRPGWAPGWWRRT